MRVLPASWRARIGACNIDYDHERLWDEDRAYSDQRISAVAGKLALVRTGAQLSKEDEKFVKDTLEDIVTQLDITPDELNSALCRHEPILGTDEGLDGDLGGGSSVSEPQLV